MKNSWHIPRRTVLKGLGASVALPFLETMNSVSRAEQQASKPPVRLMFRYDGAATNMEEWFPKDDGPNYTLSRALKPMEKHREHFSVISGTRHFCDNPSAGGGSVGGHGSGRVWLTGHFSGGTDSQGRGKISTHSSVDQLAAEVIGRETRFDSLQLGSSSSQDTMLSWNRNGTPLPTINSPGQVFRELFVDKAADDKREIRDVFSRNRSILDLVTDNRKSLERRMSDLDRQKFEQYLTSVRELEQKIQRREQWVDIPKQKPAGLSEPDRDVERSKDLWLETMYDLIVKAFETDSTRVIALARNGPQDYRQVVEGVTEAWHPISHHSGNAEKLEMAAKINEYLMDHFGRFLGKLDQVQDSDGNSVLHNSLILYGDSMTDGGHWGGNLPLVLAGHAGGQLKQGQHLKLGPVPTYAERNDGLAQVPTANLFVSMLNLAGVPTDHVADSTGPLEGLV
ncbi:DUF1552 domain-containing protein [Stratiformator vulcanicus]|uniref:DUF1552 domain-containing protein n=1 Tax=Stratiformator vulcanicus TaxID=2527980 RepID=A0A517QY03_9PLAN|nr:DUF1552 domain-containing protein [Stratiformator vulcanicus]QDT36521.1 hypothetical protein Pan189_08800 [Stratiformator vulcanicus]